jgi:hypothetical protein
MYIAHGIEIGKQGLTRIEIFDAASSIFKARKSLLLCAQGGENKCRRKDPRFAPPARAPKQVGGKNLRRLCAEF